MEISNDDYERYGYHVTIKEPSISPIAVKAHVWRIETKDRCSFCGVAGLISDRCGSCQQEHYCSRKCLQSGWEEYHAIECEIYSKLVKVAGPGALTHMTVSVKNFLRLYSAIGGFYNLSKVGRYGQKTKRKSDEPYKEDFEAMGHRGETLIELMGFLYGSKKDVLRNCKESDLDGIVMIILRVLTSFDASCQKALVQEDVSIDSVKKDIATVLGVISMNAFQLTEGGFIISVNAAMLNHSSTPTHSLMESYTTHNPPKLGIAPIEGQISQGAQAFISYRNEDDISHYYGIQ